MCGLFSPSTGFAATSGARSRRRCWRGRGRGLVLGLRGKHVNIPDLEHRDGMACYCRLPILSPLSSVLLAHSLQRRTRGPPPPPRPLQRALAVRPAKAGRHVTSRICMCVRTMEESGVSHPFLPPSFTCHCHCHQPAASPRQEMRMQMQMKVQIR